VSQLTPGGRGKPTVTEALARDLGAWQPPTEAMARLRDEFSAFLDKRGAAAADRDSDEEHLTSSCFVFSADLSRILLCFHRKGRFWVQLGGHIERADQSAAAAAFREAFEEGGIAVAPFPESLVDIDRHALSSGFGSCGVHWDLGFAATAPEDAIPVVSDESDDVRWWPVDVLPEAVPAGFGSRVARIVGAIAARR
jgi:8-oxo-dGTP pyrophosphatase MutT (NUDIX family)